MKHIPMEHQPYRQKRDHIRQHKCLLAQINCSGRKLVSLRILINVPSNFSKSVCVNNFFCAIFYQDSSVFAMACMKYVQKHFWKEHLCALQVFFCALVSWLVCAELAGGSQCRKMI